MHGKWNKLTNGERKDLYSPTERDMHIGHAHVHNR